MQTHLLRSWHLSKFHFWQHHHQQLKNIIILLCQSKWNEWCQIISPIVIVQKVTARPFLDAEGLSAQTFPADSLAVRPLQSHGLWLWEVAAALHSDVWFGLPDWANKARVVSVGEPVWASRLLRTWWQHFDFCGCVTWAPREVQGEEMINGSDLIPPLCARPCLNPANPIRECCQETGPQEDVQRWGGVSLALLAARRQERIYVHHSEGLSFAIFGLQSRRAELPIKRGLLLCRETYDTVTVYCWQVGRKSMFWENNIGSILWSISIEYFSLSVLVMMHNKKWLQSQFHALSKCIDWLSCIWFPPTMTRKEAEVVPQTRRSRYISVGIEMQE